MKEHDQIRQVLVEKGNQLLRAPRSIVPFSEVAEANALINDIEGNPHAFAIACVMDRQIKAERAWLIPHEISKRLGGFEFQRLVALDVTKIVHLMKKPTSLHRFADKMAQNLHAAVRLINTRYGGDAASIWRGEPSSATLVFRFLEFQGVGPKIATMAANILARHFKVPFSDYYSIDISADVHVRRVFWSAWISRKRCEY